MLFRNLAIQDILSLLLPILVLLLYHLRILLHRIVFRYLFFVTHLRFILKTTFWYGVIIIIVKDLVTVLVLEFKLL